MAVGDSRSHSDHSPSTSYRGILIEDETIEDAFVYIIISLVHTDVMNKPVTGMLLC